MVSMFVNVAVSCPSAKLFCRRSEGTIDLKPSHGLTSSLSVPLLIGSEFTSAGLMATGLHLSLLLFPLQLQEYSNLDTDWPCMRKD